MRHPQLSAPELSGAAGGFRRAESDNAVLLVAHGSRNPQAAGVVQELAAALRVELGGTRVAVAYLDFTDPSVGLALTELAADGVREVVAVPLLFAPGYHLRVDLPSAVAEVRAGLPWLSVAVADPLAVAPEPGEPDLLLAALEARLTQALRLSWPSEPVSVGRIGRSEPGFDGQTRVRRPRHWREGYDGVVLASAGSSDPTARAAVEGLAERWAQRSGRPVVPAYATAAGPDVTEAIERLRAQGAGRVAVSGLFIAPGRLPEATRRTAVAAGAAVVAEPLGANSQLVALLARRANRAIAHALDG
jgi:sirohydrochlorin ferrochelatase